MRKLIDDPSLMIKICDLYYNHNISQQQIAKELELSRPTVAKLLVAAREEGVVQITIPHLDSIRYWEQEKILEEKFDIKEVIVTETSDDKEELKENLAKAAARHMNRIVGENNIIGISMGSTLYHVVKNIKSKPLNVTVIPLTGGMGQMKTEWHANSLAEQMAVSYEGKFLPLYAPARVNNRLIRNQFMREDSLAPIIELMQHLDVALIGIGYPNENSAIKATGYFKDEELKDLTRRNAVGDLCMQFYDETGNTAPFRYDNNIIGIDLKKLKRVPNSIGIAGGVDKVTAIRGAVRGGYINTLITDISAAEVLIRD